MGIQDRVKGRMVEAWAQTNYSLLSSADALTAGGGTSSTVQAGATKITTMYAGFTTVPVAGASSVLLPAKKGLQITVFNNAAANAMNVFPAPQSGGGVVGGDKINAGAANAALSVLASGAGANPPIVFTCLTDGMWWTK